MGKNCAPLLADIFLYSYEAESIQSLLSAGKKQLASQFNFTYRFIDDVCPLITQTLRMFSVRCIPLSLRSKTRRRATLLLPIWICSCQWRVRIAKQETLTPPGHLVSPLVCRGPLMSTLVFYSWCHSDSASVLLYFTF